MTTSPADVTVVTVSWEGLDLTLACLDGLRAQELGDVRMDVVVVDNGSTDGTAARVAELHPWVRVVRSEVNLGFAGGNDLALREVRTPAVILLNNDATPEPGFVRAFVTALREADEQVAAMAATVLLAEHFRPATPDDEPASVVNGPDGTWVADPDGPVRLVNSTGNEVRTDGFGVDRGWLADARTHAPAAAVFGFSGAAAILRTAALLDVGYFDERLFMYYEDTDLSWRLRLAGYRVEHAPGAVVSHVHAASSREGSDFFRFHDARNRLAITTKNATARFALRVWGAFVLTTASVALRRRQPWRVVRTRLRALASCVTLLPHLLSERRRVGRRAVVPRSAVEALFIAPAVTGAYRAGTRGPSGATR
ncbi:glycosyltransferase family 2 protein [Cellulomonas sp.]|uniref:glycosyltransferase family 2 protein n=1 Tax=Cellulomonas sp. TaxID=40001 RepID=UPI001AFDEC99|nr:glycosyltransferase family 2 protein [Cellulomonas sp.]MBO9555476.1 glycosyltransferase family 2 protein [Cellulomonas sp.]